MERLCIISSKTMAKIMVIMLWTKARIFKKCLRISLDSRISYQRISIHQLVFNKKGILFTVSKNLFKRKQVLPNQKKLPQCNFTKLFKTLRTLNNLKCLMTAWSHLPTIQGRARISNIWINSKLCWNKIVWWVILIRIRFKGEEVWIISRKIS